MMTFNLHPALIELVRSCEYGNIFEVEGGYDISADHEVSYLIVERQGLYQLGRYERLGSVAVIAASTNAADLERYVAVQVGDSYRAYGGYAPIELPHAPEFVDPNFEVLHIGAEIFTLRRVHGEQLGIQIDDYPPTVPITCRYSHVADRSIEDIVASYMAKNGDPLYGRYLG